MPGWRPFLARTLQRLRLPRAAAGLLLAAAGSGKTRDVKRFFVALNLLPDPEERNRFAECLRIDRTHATPQPHGLHGRLVVSLTSYPKRYPTLHRTLRCLLEQSVRADRIILWIAHQDREPLPASVLDLQAHGLEIKRCDDLRSYNKVLPTLQEAPEAFIVTADDDLYYPVDWLQRLVEHARRDPERITALRARQIRLGEDGMPKPYSHWNVIRPSGNATAHETAPELIFPTGVGGVLYPPGALRSSAQDVRKIVELAPYADDIGLYWIWRSNGRLASAVPGEKFDVAVWPGTQVRNLMSLNVDRRGNDEQVKNLLSYWGAGVFRFRSLTHFQPIAETRPRHERRVPGP